MNIANFLRTDFFIEHPKWLRLRRLAYLSFTACKCIENETIAQKMKFSITDFFSKCNEMRSFLKPVMKNFIFHFLCSGYSLKVWGDGEYSTFSWPISCHYNYRKGPVLWFSDVLNQGVEKEISDMKWVEIEKSLLWGNVSPRFESYGHLAIFSKKSEEES